MKISLAELHRQLTKSGVISSTIQYLDKLVAQGKLPHTINKANGKKVYKYEECVQALSEMRQFPKEAGKTKKGGKETKTLTDGRIKLVYEQARLAKQKADVEEGKYILKDEVVSDVYIAVRILRDQILAIPERLAGELASNTNVAEVKEIMYRELGIALEALSDVGSYDE